MKMAKKQVKTNELKNNGDNNPAKPPIVEKIQSMVDASQADWNGEKLPAPRALEINNGDRLLSDLVIENRL